MFCSRCGKQIIDNARFCPSCGAPISPPQAAPAQQPYSQPAADPKSDLSPEEQAALSEGRQISRHITLGSDGVYRWIYEYSLFKKPHVFWLIWSIFFFVAVGVFAILAIVTASEGNMDGQKALDYLKYFGIAVAGLTVLVGICYLIYAAIMGGKYVAMFEMNDAGVYHKQIDKQARRADKIADATFWIGIFTGSHTAVNSGTNMSTSMYTEFKKIRGIKVKRRRDLIKIREILTRNQIFAYPEDFDFVLNYVAARIPETTREKLKD